VIPDIEFTIYRLLHYAKVTYQYHACSSAKQATNRIPYEVCKKG